MKKWILIALGMFIALNMITYGSDLPAQDAKVIEAAGVPIYPDAPAAPAGGRHL